MDTQSFEQYLEATIADERLSRTEREALLAVLKESGALVGSADKLAQLRAVAFRLAGDRITEPHARRLLEWLEDVVKLLVRGNASVATVGAKAYFSPGNGCRNAVIGEFGRAKKTVDVCVFTITDDRITQAVLDAHRRGVRMRVVTDNDKSLDVGSDTEELERAGVVVRVDQTPHHMHHKYAIFDGRRLLNGSYNWTRSASEFNEENLVATEEADLVRQFAQHFEELWSSLA